MRVLLNVLSGYGAGRSIAVVPGTPLTIGRNESADFVVGGDNRMSSKHFSLTHEGEVCTLRDLGSRNGTFVNGEQITEKLLNDGDEITAGETKFVVRHWNVGANAGLGGSGANPIATATVVNNPRREPPLPPGAITEPMETIPAARPQPSKLLGASTVPAQRGGKIAKAVYTKKSCDSGLFQFQGVAPEPTPPVIAKSLSEHCPMYLLIDVNRVGIALPDQIANPDFLFDWLPKDAAAKFSPVLFPSNGPVNVFRLLEKGWGKNACLCLFSEENKDDLLDHLRLIARGQDSADGPLPTEPELVGFCWPKIAAAMLLSSPHETADFLLTGIDAAFMESKGPSRWQAFSGPAFSSALEQIGFEPAAEA